MTDTLIRALKSRIKTLELENEKLRQKLEKHTPRPSQDYPFVAAHFSMTTSEAIILSEIAKKQVVEFDVVYNALYGERRESRRPQINTVRALVMRVKKKLKPYGFTIKTIYGTGFYMPKEGRDYVTQVVTGNAEGLSPNE